MCRDNTNDVRVYPNLEAEMTRNGVTRQDLADLLEVRYATIISKLNGEYSFKYDEAIKIKNSKFPDLMLEYLFAKSE